MSAIDLIKSAKAAENKLHFSIEVLPPSTFSTLKEFYASINEFVYLQPLFINITSHGSKDSFDSLFIAKTLMQHFNILTIPHITCESFETINRAINFCQFVGIHDLMVIRGDAPLTFNSFKYASELVSYIKTKSPEFCTGAACYPEKHFESVNLDADIDSLKKKQDLGADYLITQMFFDNRNFYEFYEKCLKAGITIPIIPGIKPVFKTTQLNKIRDLFHTQFPISFINQMLATSTTAEMKQTGTDWCKNQILDLKANGFNHVHLFTMNRPSQLCSILKSILNDTNNEG